VVNCIIKERNWVYIEGLNCVCINVDAINQLINQHIPKSTACRFLIFFVNILSFYTRNTLHCDQSNYCLCIVLSYIPIEFGQTGNSAV